MSTRRLAPITRAVSRRRFLGAVAIGAVGALLAACGSADLLPATATPAPLPTPPPPIPSPSPPPPTPRPSSTPARTTTATMATWRDPAGLVALQYPSDWTATVNTMRPNNILELHPAISPGIYPALWLDRSHPAQSTPSDATQRKRDELAADTQFIASDVVAAELTIDGEPGESLTFTSTPRFNPTLHTGWQYVAVNHGGDGYVIEATPRPYSGPSLVTAIDAILASIRFLT